jgi:hypothetical protein
LLRGAGEPEFERFMREVEVVISMAGLGGGAVPEVSKAAEDLGRAGGVSKRVNKKTTCGDPYLKGKDRSWARGAENTSVLEGPP